MTRGGACLWAMGGATVAVGAPVVGVAITDGWQNVIENEKDDEKMNENRMTTCSNS